MINRNEAIVLLKKYLRDEDNIRFSYAVEAILRDIAKKLGRDEEVWGLTGLLHNLDYEYTLTEPENRGVLSSQLLEDLLPERAVNAIKANNYTHTEYIPTTSIDKSLIAVNAATIFIMTAARTLPSKKLADVDLGLLISKFNDHTFVAKANRSRIQLCGDIGMELDSFLKLCLEVLKKMSDVLNL